MKNLFGFALLVVSLCLPGSLAEAAKKHFVTIGTGGITGVYYPTGGAIAKFVNRQRKKYNIRASVESTGGSVYNINAVMSGDLEFGIAQSDLQFQAVKGLSEWAKKGKGPQKDLRSVLALHTEIVTVIAAEESKINSLADLKGKRVNIGNHGSGNRENAIDILKSAGLNWKTDLSAESLKPAEAPKMLQDGRIDAFFYTIGHPNGNITEATSGRRKVKFIPVTGMENLLKKTPYYAAALIPTNLYPMSVSKSSVPSIGLKATLVTSIKVPTEVVYAITKEVFEHLEEFKKLHPAFANLDKKAMLQGSTAPLHPGAEKYFKEVGLKK